MDIIREEDRISPLHESDKYPEFCGVEIPPAFTFGNKAPGLNEVLTLASQEIGELMDAPARIGEVVMRLRRDAIVQQVEIDIAAATSDLENAKEKLAQELRSEEDLLRALTVTQHALNTHGLKDQDRRWALTNKATLEQILAQFERVRNLRARVAYCVRYKKMVEKLKTL